VVKVLSKIKLNYSMQKLISLINITLTFLLKKLRLLKDNEYGKNIVACKYEQQ